MIQHIVDAHRVEAVQIAALQHRDRERDILQTLLTLLSRHDDLFKALSARVRA